jgi:pilus assembly protein Flp/PilA
MAGGHMRNSSLRVVQEMYARIVTRIDQDRGSTATEYAMLAGFVALAIVVGVTFFGQNLNDWFDRLGGAVKPFTS